MPVSRSADPRRTGATDASRGGPKDIAAPRDSKTTYARLKEEILLGTLPPGTRLVETLLAERYAVSRTPVREALGRLVHDGLVERAGRGMCVRVHTPEEIFELYEVRELLETAAARTAAERRTEFDIVRLQTITERLNQPDITLAERAPLNREFHASIWKAGHNSMLVDTLDRLTLHILQHMSTTLTSPGRWEQAIVEHRKIVEAIVDGNGEAAGQLVSEHLRAARSIRLSAQVNSSSAG